MKKNGHFALLLNFIIIFIILLYTIINKNNKVIGYELPQNINTTIINITTISETSETKEIIIKETENKITENKIIETQEVKTFYDKELTENDKYLLAKIAMSEAGNQSIKTKILVIMSVLNRVESPDFPDSISEVIFQKSGNVYQYSPVIPNGNWYRTEPDVDCYKALEVVLNLEYDYSNGALYFESCENKDNWHSNNLTYLYQSDDLRFYK